MHWHLHNVCVKHARKCMIRLQHDKRYAELRQLYNELVKKKKMSKEEKSQKKKIGKAIRQFAVQKSGTVASLLKHYIKVWKAIFQNFFFFSAGTAEADRVWCGVERCLFGNGKNFILRN